MSHQRVTDRILDMALRDPECTIEDVMRLCPDLTWNQVFLDVDRLSGEGRVRLRLCARGVYMIEVLDQEVHRGGLADRVDAQMMQEAACRSLRLVDNEKRMKPISKNFRFRWVAGQEGWEQGEDHGEDVPLSTIKTVEDHVMRKTPNAFICGLMLCLTAGIMGSPVGAASPVTMRIVQGEVVATNLRDALPVIVVKVTLPNREELIVGATVPEGAHVTRGKRAVTLAEIKTGERVVLGYVKQPDGLTARSIHVQ